MSRTPWLSLALLVMATPSPVVLAQTPDTTSDVRCVAVGLRFAELPDSPQKSTGLLMALYYIGRLDGRDPNLDLKVLLAAQLAKMTAADFSQEGVRCGSILSSKGAELTHTGQDLAKQLGAK
jgi:hypothetical protein